METYLARWVFLILTALIVCNPIPAYPQQQNPPPAVPQVFEVVGASRDCHRQISFAQGANSQSPNDSRYFEIYFAKIVRSASGVTPSGQITKAVVPDQQDQRGFTTPVLASNSLYRFSIRACSDSSCTSRTASPWVSRDFQTTSVNTETCLSPPVISSVTTVTNSPCSQIVTLAGSARSQIRPTEAYQVFISEVGSQSNGLITERFSSGVVTITGLTWTTPPLTAGASYDIFARACADAACRAVSAWGTRRITAPNAGDLSCRFGPSAPTLAAISSSGCDIAVGGAAASNGIPARGILLELYTHDMLAAESRSQAAIDRKVLGASAEMLKDFSHTFTATASGSYRVTTRACIDQACTRTDRLSESSSRLINITRMACGSRATDNSYSAVHQRALEVLRNAAIGSAGVICKFDAAINQPPNPPGCDGSFNVRIPLNFVVSADQPLSSALGGVTLAYNSNAADKNAHGFGFGWMLSPFASIERDSATTNNATMLVAGQTPVRLVASAGATTAAIFNSDRRALFSFSGSKVVFNDQSRGVRSEFTALSNILFRLSSIAVAKKVPNSSINGEISLELAANSGAILFSNGERVSITYQAPQRLWRIQGADKSSFVALGLNRFNQLGSVRAVEGGKQRDYRFNYDQMNRITSYTVNDSAGQKSYFAIYNPDGSLNQEAAEGWVTRYERQRNADNSATFRVSGPNRVVESYTFSASGALLEQAKWNRGEESQVNSYWGVARYSYGSNPDGVQFLRAVVTQEAGERYTTEFRYDQQLPSFITSATRYNSAGERVSLVEASFNHQVGASDYSESKIFGAQGAAGETIAGFRINEREGDGEWRPTRITNLVTQAEQRFSYAADGSFTVTDVDKSGITVRERSFMPGERTYLLSRAKDPLGAFIGEERNEYDALGNLVRRVAADGSTLVITRVDGGGIESTEEVSALGVRRVTRYDVRDGAVVSVETQWPTGVSEGVSYRYERDSAGEVTSVVKTKRAVSGEVSEERLGG